MEPAWIDRVDSILTQGFGTAFYLCIGKASFFFLEPLLKDFYSHERFVLHGRIASKKTGIAVSVASADAADRTGRRHNRALCLLAIGLARHCLLSSWIQPIFKPFVRMAAYPPHRSPGSVSRQVKSTR